MRQKCSLLLNDGSRFEGVLIGAPLEASGELVFTTGMVGYSEAITDPSYFGQILTFAYPLIGNYGIPTHELGTIPVPVGFESDRVRAAAVIVTVDSPDHFHWSSAQSLARWLEQQGVPGIVGLDTRHLVHQIRQKPRLLARVVPEQATGTRQQMPGWEGEYFDPGEQPILPMVSVSEPVVVSPPQPAVARVGLIDCGVKWNIVRQLLAHHVEVVILPWDADLGAVDCGGWLISNGPGDPTKTGDLVDRVRLLLSDDRPVLGICLGHQILALAAGARAARMNYGHRSHNQPVYLVGTRRGFITSQNHGYVIDDSSLDEGWEPWFRNVNDDTLEGIRHISKPYASVQFHPEAAGGPRDSAWVLTEFVEKVAR